MATAVDGEDRDRGLRWIATERLIELDGLPPDGQSTESSFVVSFQPSVTAVPPAVSWLDAELDVGPGEVDVDPPTGGDVEWKLTGRLWKSDRSQCFDHVEFEPALSGAFLIEREIKPAFDSECSILPHSAVVAEIGGC